MDTLSKLASIDEDAVTDQPFKPYEEEMIISLALDHPDFFLSAARFLKPDHFGKLECKWVIAEILNIYESSSIIPTRPWLRSHLEKKITEDDSFEEVFRLVDRKSDPREVPLVKDSLLKWSKERAYGLLYSDEAMEAFHRSDFEYLENIVNEAHKIADVGNNGFWFFQDIARLFQPDAVEHLTTGFPRLDAILNNGGPSRKEVVCWLAATNMGKCCVVSTRIIEERLSRIYELELEDGKIIKLRGSREVQTTRGRIKVADLTISDSFSEISIGDDTWDLEL